MKTKAVYLRPRGAIMTPITSDLLFGATCWGIQVLGKSLQQIIGTNLSPRFAFSGAFPYWQGNQGIYHRFFPLPFTFTLDPQKVSTLTHVTKITSKNLLVEKVDRLKEMKEIQFTSEEIFLKIINGSLTPFDVLVDWMNDGKEFKNLDGFLVSQTELATWFKEGFQAHTPFGVPGATQHNQIDRVTGSTGDGLLFYEDEVRFPENYGLWSVLTVTNPIDIQELIEPALRYLSDTGLGGNRTSGMGQFDISLGETIALPDAGNKANGFMTLSRYLPGKNEWEGNSPLRYHLIDLWPKREKKFAVPRTNNASQPIYKQRIRLFEPGSVFPLSKRQELYGRLAQVVPEKEGDHAVYQCGYGLPVFLFAPEGD